MHIGQVGMGYVGLLSAAYFALDGNQVICYDTDSKVVQSLRDGTPKSGEFLSYLQTDINRLVKNGRIVPTEKFEFLQYCDAYFLSVPTERKDLPFMNIVEECVIKIVSSFSKEDFKPLIIIESTLTPGTTEKIVSELKQKNFNIDEHYYLAVAPRRDWFADEQKNLTTLKRVVGGCSELSTNNAVAIIQQICPQIQKTTAEIAEMTKSVENALLNVQVSLIENLACIYPHLNMNKVVDLATNGHWRLNPLHLGAGIGGRCIPLSIDYLNKGTNNNYNYLLDEIKNADIAYRNTIVDVVYEHAVKMCENIPNIPVVKIGILGVGYRKDFKDIGNSPGLYFASELEKESTYFITKYNKAFDVQVFDPLFTIEEIHNLEHNYFDYSKGWDILVLAAPHTYFMENFDDFLKSRNSIECNPSVIIDTYGQWENNFEFLKELNIKYIRVGNANWKNV